MDKIIAQFTATHSNGTNNKVYVVYGSSGKFRTQIESGAPFDLYFSADIAYPQMLVDKGLSSTQVIPYATGRLVLWSRQFDLSGQGLNSLLEDKFKRIAIANPRHAPYGIRARQALIQAGIWSKIQHKLVFAESISHAAQYVTRQHTQAGLIALSLVRQPALTGQPRYQLLDEHLHQPLLQGFIITKHGGRKTLSRQFANFIQSPKVSAILAEYGFSLP